MPVYKLRLKVNVQLTCCATCNIAGLSGMYIIKTNKHTCLRALLIEAAIEMSNDHLHYWTTFTFTWGFVQTQKIQINDKPSSSKKNDEWVAASILILKKSFNESILCCEHKRIKIKEVVRIHTQARLFVFYTRTRFIWLWETNLIADQKISSSVWV